MQSRGIAVLGMHRSGTSMLAGTLRAAGVYFGRVLDKPFALNPKGLQEAPAILFMHENLLKANGGSWHEPPAAVKWQKLHEAVRDLFIESRAEQRLWGFKDPRTILVLDDWIDNLPALTCTGIFRHPAEVALSIHQRNDFDMAKCFEIWRRYNEALLQQCKKRKFPIVEFVGDGAVMKSAFERLMDRLDLTLKPGALDFYDVKMKHIDKPDIEVPDDILRLYRQLQAQAL